LNGSKKKYYTFDYILYVGNAYPHKNLERLIQAFSIVRKTRNIKLVLAGDDKYFYPRLKKYSNEIGMEADIIFFGEANDRQLISLYSQCSCLVFPSLMEGFGLPNLEVLSCHKFPVASNIPVFREIWKDTLEYFDPNSVYSMAKAILKVLSWSSATYKDKVNLARKIVEKYSWKKTASKTLVTYENSFRI